MSADSGILRPIRPFAIRGHENGGDAMPPKNDGKSGVFISGHAPPKSTHAFTSAHENKNKAAPSVSMETHHREVPEELKPFVTAMVELCVRRLAVASRGER